MVLLDNHLEKKLLEAILWDLVLHNCKSHDREIVESSEMERKLAALTPIRLWALTLLPDYTIHSYGLTSTYLLNHPQYKIIKRAHTSLLSYYVTK